MKIAYADPPYLGLAKSFYGDPTYDDPEMHRMLIRRLVTDFDAWVLHLHVPSLRAILSMCPAEVRIGSWVKRFFSFKPNVNPAYGWEPVIFYGGRKLGTLEWETVRDWCDAPMATEKGLRGAKPFGVIHWALSFLGADPFEDILMDLFPGSGQVGRAWEQYRTQFTIFRPGGALLKRPRVADRTLDLCDGEA